MAKKQDIENAEAIEVYTDAGNPSPSFRPVLTGNVPRIRTAKDARKLYGRLISQFTRGEVAGEDARTLAYLLSGFIQACAASEIEERVEALERSNAK